MPSPTQQLAAQWKELIVGQDHAVDRIVPYIIRYKAGMNAPKRPIGVFFLLGPTGTGKTRTAETLAELLHGDENKLLKIDCGEFRLEHETAKLVGAPPGYLGHKDTQPLLSQIKLNGVASEKSDISIVLFDEIEKGHNSLWRLLLGVMDKAQMRMGDNQNVSFEKSIIFMSSNIGAAEMQKTLLHRMGFPSMTADPPDQLEKIGMTELTKRFPPEFPNRIDETITYKLLEHEQLLAITHLEIKKIQTQILNRLGVRTFFLKYEDDVIEFLAKEGTSQIYGARELKRVLTRYLTNPLSDDFVNEIIKPGSQVDVHVDSDKLVWDVSDPEFTLNPDGTFTFNEVKP